MKLARILIVVALVLPNTNVLASEDFNSGNYLLKNCEDGEEDKMSWFSGFCSAFIYGVTQTHANIGQLTTEHKLSLPLPRFCIVGTTNAQRQRVVVKWLRDNPDQLHRSAAALVYGALVDAYPCVSL